MADSWLHSQCNLDATEARRRSHLAATSGEAPVVPSKALTWAVGAAQRDTSSVPGTALAVSPIRPLSHLLLRPGVVGAQPRVDLRGGWTDVLVSVTSRGVAYGSGASCTGPRSAGAGRLGRARRARTLRRVIRR